MHPFLNFVIVLSGLISVMPGAAVLSAQAEPTPSPASAVAKPATPKKTPSPRKTPKKRARPYTAPAGRAQVSENVTGFEGLAIRSIDVSGLKRIEKDAVLNKLVTKTGQLVRAEILRTDVQALFNMGYFDDIEIAAEPESGGAKLIVSLKERPVISEIEFFGNDRISTSDLEGVAKVKQWSILDLNKVKEDLALLQKHYEEKGFYLAKVNFELFETKKPDEVRLRYRINDYEKVQIKRITFLNNRAFSDDQLKAALGETKEGGFFSFMSGSGNFKESGFKVDLQRLVYWYLDHGYVKFKYDSPIVTISDDKKWLFITISVDEGEQYRLGHVDFSGDLLFSREELGQDLTLKTDETFSITKRNADIQKLQEKYQDLGYAFVNVVPKMDVKDDSKTVDIDYGFEKGSLAYFGEIKIVGNTKTHDKVIRRELKIKEGELYHGTRLRQSKENVERLGFFQPGEVLFNTSTPKGRTDVVDLEIAVKERPTGQITLGAGYGSVKGLFFTTTISESNFLGKGQNISLATNLTRDRRDKSINLGFTDPYAFDTNWSAGFDAYYTTFYIPSKYTTRRLGFDVRLGYPILEYTNAYITYKREGMKIEDVAFSDRDPTDTAGVAADQAEIDADTGTLSSIIWSLVRDKRNNRFETTGGSYQSLSLETAGFGGDKRFIKWIANSRFYTRVIGDLVFRNMLEYGQANGIQGRGVPPSERFYLGGPNNLKGYDFYSVGPERPRRLTTGETIDIPTGGEYEVLGLFELEHPLIREAGLKFVAFYDAGNVFEDLPALSHMTLRQDWGFGFRWFSPIGPLRFEWGFPINPQQGDDSSVFSFFIGPPF